MVGGEINQRIVDALKKEYDLADKVTFKSIAPADVPRAIQSKEASAFLVVVPLNEKYLTLVRRLFRDSRNSFPTLIAVNSAGAIADVEGAYESFDIPLGTLRGNPAVPDADLTTLRVGSYLVANKAIDADVITTLTQALIGVRNDLVRDQPLLAGLAAPDTDPDAYIAVHPGAAAYYNGTQQSFMDKWSNWIYLTPMVLGALASIFAAAWRFLGIERLEPGEIGDQDLVRLAAANKRGDERGRTDRNRKPGRCGAGCRDGQRHQERERAGYVHVGLAGASAGGFDPSPPARDRGEAPGGRRLVRIR